VGTVRQIDGASVSPDSGAIRTAPERLMTDPAAAQFVSGSKLEVNLVRCLPAQCKETANAAELPALLFTDHL